MRVCILTAPGCGQPGAGHGCAADLLRRRKELNREHISSLPTWTRSFCAFSGLDLETHIEWTEFYRPMRSSSRGADGRRTAGDKVRRAKELATRPILLGSGTTAENIAEFLTYADGVIVGSSLKVDGIAENPVDVERVRRYVDAVKAVRG